MVAAENGTLVSTVGGGEEPLSACPCLEKHVFIFKETQDSRCFPVIYHFLKLHANFVSFFFFL